MLPPTTRTVPLPIECRNATNFTESWRLDHSGQNIRPGGEHSYDNYACDVHTKNWFRFSSQAGNRMLNICPPYKSCGTYVPFWSDAAIPDQVGERVEAQFYASTSNNCKSETYNLSVIRCSDEPNDAVYFQHYQPRGNCRGAFCGLNWWNEGISWNTLSVPIWLDSGSCMNRMRNYVYNVTYLWYII